MISSKMVSYYVDDPPLRVRNIRIAASPWNTHKGNVEVWEIEGYGRVEAQSHPEYRQRLLDFLERTVVEEEMQRDLARRTPTGPRRPATLLKQARRGTTYLRSLEQRRFRSVMKLALPPILLRLEGAVLLALSVLLYGLNGASWLLFVLLFLVPDLSMLGYLSGPRTGAISYNLFHTYVLPGLLAAFGLLTGSPLLVSLALVWFAHIGFDRMVGYGLKYPTGFFDTHLHRP